MSRYIAVILWNIIQASLVSLCDTRLFLNMDNFTNPERDFFLVFMLILLFIQTLDHFPEIPDGRFFFDVAIIAPGPDGLKMYACHRTHQHRLKRTGSGAIIARRTITITARTGTRGTSTATVTIPIMYGCLIPLGSLKRKPPRTEPWMGWGSRPKKIWGAFKGVRYNESLVQNNKE